MRVEYRKNCRGQAVPKQQREVSQGQQVVAPCLLPESDRVACVVVDSPRHWHVRLEGDHVRCRQLLFFYSQ